MNNFEQACFNSCEKWVNSIEEIEEPNYPQKHFKKINAIANGKRIFNVYVSRTVFRLIVAAAIILSLSMVGFAVSEVIPVIPSKNITFGKSLIFENDILVFEGLDEDYARNSKVTNLEYNYIPEGYVQEEISKYESHGEQNGYWAVRKFNNGDKHFEIWKWRENTSVPVHLDDVEIEKFTEGEINYIRMVSIETDRNGKQHECTQLYWDINGFLYSINGYISPDEALQVARYVK